MHCRLCMFFRCHMCVKDTVLCCPSRVHSLDHWVYTEKYREALSLNLFSCCYTTASESYHSETSQNNTVKLLIKIKSPFSKTNWIPSQTDRKFQSNIVGHIMLRALNHPVTIVGTCWVLLAQNWKWSNFSCNICWCCIMLYSFSQVRATLCARTRWPNQRAISCAQQSCCIEILWPFGRGLQILSQQCKVM